MPVTNPIRRTGPRRSALAAASLAAVLTVGAAVGLHGPTVATDASGATTVTLSADAAPNVQTVVRTVYQVTPTAAPPPVVVVHKVIPGGGENEHDGGGDD